MLYMQIKSPRILLRIRENGCSRWRTVSYGTWRNSEFLNTFQRLAIPEENGGGCLYCIFAMRANKRFVQAEENTRGQGREGSL